MNQRWRAHRMFVFVCSLSLASLLAVGESRGQTRTYNPVTRTSSPVKQAFRGPYSQQRAAQPAASPDNCQCKTQAAKSELRWAKPRRGQVVQAQALEPTDGSELPAPPSDSPSQGPELIFDGQSQSALQPPVDGAPGAFGPGAFGPGAIGPGGGPACNCGPGQCCGQSNCANCQLCEAASCPGDACICINWKENLSVFGGAQAFKGPRDFGVNGNFGFHDGLNWGTPISRDWGIGAQLGLMGTHSNFSGNAIGGPGNRRNQLFVTAGLFHRTNCGLQWGVAYDELNDDYYDHIDLQQWRAETSFVWPTGNEFGFSGCFSTDTSQVATFIPVLNQTFMPVWQPTNQYKFFYRRSLCNGAWYRFWGGVTNHRDGLIGGDAFLPMTNHLALSFNLNYLIPEQGNGPSQTVGFAGYQQESWNLAFSLVWFPGGVAKCGGCPCTQPGQYRPLFNVADNGSFMVDHFNGPGTSVTTQ